MAVEARRPAFTLSHHVAMWLGQDPISLMLRLLSYKVGMELVGLCVPPGSVQALRCPRKARSLPLQPPS